MTTSVNAKCMADVQSRRDERGIAIDQVGVSDLRYPIIILEPVHGRREVCAKISMSVTLPHHFKGTHMSRFIEVLNGHRGEMTMMTLPGLLQDLKQRLDAESAHIDVLFTYFIERTAPVSGAKALMDYECSFAGESNGQSDDFRLGVKIPISSLCPCSKEISDYGAHNQRGLVDILVQPRHNSDGSLELIWIEELVQIADDAASAPIYPLLKRSDERHVTMQAYDNPKFVEDIVRGTAMELQSDSRIACFTVHVTNWESIHNHNAFAKVTRVNPCRL